MQRYLNSDRARLIDEKVHSDIGRQALKRKYIDGWSLAKIAEELDMPYSTFTDKFYHKWQPELFDDFDPGK